MKKKHGFVLISVLLITTIASMLAFSAVGESRLQERIAGNQKKEINARLKAEQGVFSAFAYIQSQLTLGLLSNEEIRDNLAQHVNNNNTNINISDSSVSVDSDGLFTLVSQGTYHGGIANLKTNIKANKNKGEPGFKDTIVGCEGVVLSGSGTIDSFNSSKGIYGATYNDADGQSVVNKTKNASVATLGVKTVDTNGDISYQGADITLSGAAPIHGDVNVTGDFFSSGSANIEGNLKANGNVGFGGQNVSGPFTHLISGDISLGGDASINKNKIGGAINVVGNASDTENVVGTVSYGKNGSISGTSHLYGQDLTLTGPNVAMGECDTLELLPAITSNIDSLDELPVHNGMLKQMSGLDKLDTLIFENTASNKKADVLASNTTDGTIEQLDTQQLSVLNESNKREVFVFDSFHLRSRMITIRGDVTLVIKGDFETSGDGSGFQFDTGDTTSSLTIITEGQVNIGSDSKLFENAKSIDGNVPLSIYSGYDSAKNNKNAITLNGKTNAYVRAYAPVGDILTTNSGHIMGSIHGKTVEVSGAGGVHYDEALLNVPDKTPAQVGTAQFVSISDHYE